MRAAARAFRALVLVAAGARALAPPAGARAHLRQRPRITLTPASARRTLARQVEPRAHLVDMELRWELDGAWRGMRSVHLRMGMDASREQDDESDEQVLLMRQQARNGAEAKAKAERLGSDEDRERRILEERLREREREVQEEREAQLKEAETLKQSQLLALESRMAGVVEAAFDSSPYNTAGFGPEIGGMPLEPAGEEPPVKGPEGLPFRDEADIWLKSTSWEGLWPVGDPRANPEVSAAAGSRSIQWCRGLREDLKRKLPYYASDWKQGLTTKSLAAISFLYFASFASVVAFGGAMSSLTGGCMGVVEVLASCGLCGMAYAVLCGQPMTFLAPTGLTLAFTAALYRYCMALSLPFLPMYAWVGCWTSLMLMVASTMNASGLIRYCTRFTEDVFNALLAFNFLWEACRSLHTEFTATASAASGWLALNTATFTAWLLQSTSAFRSKRFLSERVREIVSDFGPPLVICGISALSLRFPPGLGGFTRLSMPPSFELSGGRSWLVDMSALPLQATTSLATLVSSRAHLLSPDWFGVWVVSPWPRAQYRWLAALPAVFLAMLFFLDQNITVRTVNSPIHKLNKGAAYHLDLLALGILTGVASLLGLPWMCSATVQSLNHIRAMSIYNKRKATDGSIIEVPERVIETRLTGFSVHAAILASALIVPVLRNVPIAVVSGVFLYLGKKVMSGNQFLKRCKTVFLEPELLEVARDGEKEQILLGRAAVIKFTALQVFCLVSLWALKLNPATALIFPSVIGVLMILRTTLVPRLFKPRELLLLDTAIGATRA